MLLEGCDRRARIESGARVLQKLYHPGPLSLERHRRVAVTYPPTRQPGNPLLVCESSRGLRLPSSAGYLRPFLGAECPGAGMSADLLAHRRKGVYLILGDSPSRQIHDQFGPLGDITRPTGKFRGHQHGP